jgi:hypothetical protein
VQSANVAASLDQTTFQPAALSSETSERPADKAAWRAEIRFLIAPALVGSAVVQAPLFLQLAVSLEPS